MGHLLTLECDSGWRTARLEVTSRGVGWTRELVLNRNEEGWTSRTSSSGRVDPRIGDLPPPGIENPDVLQDAVDWDLGLCPLTNTMPIRRLDRLETNVEETLLTMASVDMPSLHVIPQRSDTPRIRCPDAGSYATRAKHGTSDRTSTSTNTVWSSVIRNSHWPGMTDSP